MIRVVFVLVCVARVASAQTPDAERLYTEGQKAYDDKRYADAVAAWQKSYELSKLPGLVYNLAQAYRLGGECTKAVAAYRRFVELDPKSSLRESADGFVKELEPCHDAPPIPAKEPIVVAPPPPKPPVDQVDVDTGHRKRVIGVIAAAGGVAIIATGAYFGNQARSLGDDVRAACAAGCTWNAIADKDAAGRRDEKLQWILYGAGAAVAITGGVSYLLGNREHHLVVAPHGNGGTVSFATSW